MSTKLKTAVIVVALGTIAAVCVLFASRPEHEDQVSLSFQRYSDHDLYVDHMAYLWLTNASNKSYLLSEPGNTNSTALGNLFHPERISCMVDCEFSDKTPSGWSNWMQQPPLSQGGNSYRSLGPQSGFLIRVPLQTNGWHRKVAVLYEERTMTPPFWVTRFGLHVFLELPRSLQAKVLHPKPLLREVWYDGELSYPGESKKIAKAS